MRTSLQARSGFAWRPLITSCGGIARRSSRSAKPTTRLKRNWPRWKNSFAGSLKRRSRWRQTERSLLFQRRQRESRLGVGLPAINIPLDGMAEFWLGADVGSREIPRPAGENAGLRDDADPFELGREPSGGARRFDVESLRGSDRQHNKNCQHHELRDQEWRLFSGRRQRFEGRYLHEKLGHQNEDVKPERDCGPDDVDPTPRAGKMKDVARRNRDRQHYKRDDANDMGGQQVIEGKTKAAHAGQDGGDQEKRSYAVKRLCGEKAEHDNEA